MLETYAAVQPIFQGVARAGLPASGGARGPYTREALRLGARSATSSRSPYAAFITAICIAAATKKNMVGGRKHRADGDRSTAMARNARLAGMKWVDGFALGPRADESVSWFHA